MTQFKVYEYPLKDNKGKTYYGSYTIKDGVKPLGYSGERLIQTFSADTSMTEARTYMKDRNSRYQDWF